MNRPERQNLEDYYSEAESWSADRAREISVSRKVAWIIAGVAAAIALVEAIALVLLVPLKTVVPYTLLVDRQTGYVEALKPSDRRIISPDSALVRSFLVQYVTAREGFDIDQLKENYRKVALWSAETARSRYISETQATNPQSALATLPRRAVLQVQIVSVSSLGQDSALVRFTTTRTDPGSQAQFAQHWAAVIKYRFNKASMSAADRMVNPLGFQVVRYSRDAETLPEVEAPSTNSVSVTMPSPASPDAAASGLTQPPALQVVR